MEKRGSDGGATYVDWLTEDTLEEGPLSDLAHRGKRALTRAGLAARTFTGLGRQSANGEFDVMDVTAKIRNHYLRDSKAIGVPYTMQTLANFLLNKYGVQIDPETGKVLNADPRVAAPGSPQASAQQPQRPQGPTPTSATDYRKGQLGVSNNSGQVAQNGSVNLPNQDYTNTANSSEPQEPETPQEPEAPESTAEPPSSSDKPEGRAVRYKVDSPDGQQALQQAAMLLHTPNPSGARTMQAIQRLLQAAKRDGNPEEKKFVANWLKTQRDDPAQLRKVPQLANLDDALLNKFMENWIRLLDCSIYLVEAEVRSPEEVKEVVEHFFFEAFNPNAKIDLKTIDSVLTGVAKYLNAADAVDFKDKSHGPNIGFINRGNADAHVDGEPGGLQGVTAQRTGQPAAARAGTAPATASAGAAAIPRPVGSAPARPNDENDYDGDGVTDDHDANVSASLNVREFEDTLEELGMTDEEIKEVWDKARSYRYNPRELYDSIRDAKSVDWAKRIAVAAMISILVDLR